MRRQLLLIVAALGLAWAVAVSASVQPTRKVNQLAPLHGQPSTLESVQDMYIVSFHPSTRTEVVDAAISLLPEGFLKSRYTHALNGFAARLTPALVQMLRSHADVAFLEHDSIATISAVQDTSQGPTTSGPLWGLDVLDNGQYDNKYDDGGNQGEGVTVWVIDTGIRESHTEFSDGGRASRAANCVGGTCVAGGIADDNGHGTHCAGTVAGRNTGVAKKATIKAVKVFPASGSGPMSDIVAGIDYVRVNAVSPAVASLSLGGGLSSSTNLAVANLVSSGIPAIVAAGNNGAIACNYSPASEPTAFTVGAVQPHATEKKYKAETLYSNYGSCVDIYAPGGDAGSPLPPQPGRTIESGWFTADNAYNSISGTSMATPAVAGLAARYLSKNRSATPTQVYTALLNAATDDVVYCPAAYCGTETLRTQPFAHVTGGGLSPVIVVVLVLALFALAGGAIIFVTMVRPQMMSGPKA